MNSVQLSKEGVLMALDKDFSAAYSPWVIFSKNYQLMTTDSLPSLFAMKILMNVSQMFVSHMCVNLRGADIGMPEKRLHTAEVGTIGK